MREAQQLMASFKQTYKRADGKPVDDEYLKELASFVYRKVSLVLTQVPEGMDLNKLFEVINNRGIQLQHHEILRLATATSPAKAAPVTQLCRTLVPT